MNIDIPVYEYKEKKIIKDTVSVKVKEIESLEKIAVSNDRVFYCHNNEFFREFYSGDKFESNYIKSLEDKKLINNYCVMVNPFVREKSEVLNGMRIREKNLNFSEGNISSDLKNFYHDKYPFILKHKNKFLINSVLPYWNVHGNHLFSTYYFNNEQKYRILPKYLKTFKYFYGLEQKKQNNISNLNIVNINDGVFCENIEYYSGNMIARDKINILIENLRIIKKNINILIFYENDILEKINNIESDILFFSFSFIKKPNFIDNYYNLWSDKDNLNLLDKFKNTQIFIDKLMQIVISHNNDKIKILKKTDFFNYSDLIKRIEPYKSDVETLKGSISPHVNIHKGGM